METRSITFFLLISTVMMVGCISLKRRFVNNVEDRMEQKIYRSTGEITDSDIVALPPPVQRYFRYCGYIGKEKMTDAFITWDKVFLKMAPDKKWSRISCYQYNMVRTPARFDYMKSHYLGILPFEGSHMYHDSQGSMQIVLMRLFTVVDGKGTVFNQSELVTILSEVLFVPSYAFQPYITWTPVNDSCAMATLRYDSTEVSGFFHFAPNGSCTRFDTEDRYYDNHDGTYKKVKWSAVIDNYDECNGLIYPGNIKAIWHTDQGDFEYFKGRIADVKFNFRNPDLVRLFW